MIDLALIASLCGLAAAFSWGFSDFLAARATKNLSPEIAALFTGIVTVIAFSLFFIFNHGSTPWSLAGIGFSAATGLFMGLGILCFYRGFDIGPVSVVSPIGSAYPLVTLIISLLVLGGRVSNAQLLGILLVVVGIIAASGFFTAKKTERRLNAGVVYAIGTFVMWGIAFALLGKAVSLIGWEKATFVDVCFELLAVSLVLPFLKGRLKFSFSRSSLKILTNKYIVSAALIQLFGLVIFNIGLTKSTSVAVITAISASYPAITIFLALKHFEEKITFIPIAGAVITVIGIVVLSV